MGEKWPTSRELTDALLRVLIKLGGSVSVIDLDREVLNGINLSESQLQMKRSDNRTEIQYRLAWIRTKAKQNGLVTREANRVWRITDKGRASIES